MKKETELKPKGKIINNCEKCVCYFKDYKISNIFSGECKCKCHTHKENIHSPKGQGGEDAKGLITDEVSTKSKDNDRVSAKPKVAHTSFVSSQDSSPSSFEKELEREITKAFLMFWKAIDEKYIEKSIVERDYITKKEHFEQIDNLMVENADFVQKEIQKIFKNLDKDIDNATEYYESIKQIERQQTAQEIRNKLIKEVIKPSKLQPNTIWISKEKWNNFWQKYLKGNEK